MNGISNDKRIVILGAIAFALVFFLLYPNFYHYTDEQTYLRNAYLLPAGKMKIGNPLYSYGYVFNGTDYVSMYPPLQSIAIMPFALAGWQFSFLSGLLLHLLNLLIFYKILKKLGLPVVFSLLYLFFPSMALLSTTLEAELLSATCILLAAYFFLGAEKKSPFLSGLFLGLSVLARYTNLLVVPAFFIAFLLEKKPKNALVFLLGAVPSAVLAMIYNNFLYGGPLATAYSILGVAQFSFQDFWLKAGYYALLLSVVFPLMLFSVFFAKNSLRNPAIMASVFFLLFWSSYFFFYPRFRIEDLAIGIDKFVPIIPLMLIAYSECLNGLLKRFSLEKHMKKIVAVVFVVLLAASAFAMFEHKQKQDHDFAVFKKIYSETPEGALIIVDENVSSLSPAFKETPYTGMFFTEFFGDRKLASIKEDFSKPPIE